MTEHPLEPLDDVSGVDLPPRFAEALERVRALIAWCEAADIPKDTVVAALTAELMPRLVLAYGPDGAVTVLGRLANAIAADEQCPPARH